jgi:hypothetical protein
MYRHYSKCNNASISQRCWQVEVAAGVLPLLVRTQKEDLRYGGLGKREIGGDTVPGERPGRALPGWASPGRSLTRAASVCVIRAHVRWRRYPRRRPCPPARAPGCKECIRAGMPPPGTRPGVHRQATDLHESDHRVLRDPVSAQELVPQVSRHETRCRRRFGPVRPGPPGAPACRARPSWSFVGSKARGHYPPERRTRDIVTAQAGPQGQAHKDR